MHLTGKVVRLDLAGYLGLKEDTAVVQLDSAMNSGMAHLGVPNSEGWKLGDAVSMEVVAVSVKGDS